MQKNLKLIFIPANKTSWWTNSGQWIHDSVWQPWPKNHIVLFFLVSQLYTEKPLWKLKDCSLLKLEGTFFPSHWKSQWYWTFPTWHTKAILQPNSVVWFHRQHPQASHEGQNWSHYWLLWYWHLSNHQILQQAHKPPLCNLGAAELPKAKDYIWGAQKFARTWSRNKTKPYSC